MFKNQARTPTSLTVLYDSACGFCVSCRRWLEAQAAWVPLRFVPKASSLAKKHFPELEGPEWADELIVISDEGDVYPAADAWILCLWALADYREWALRLSTPALRPFARQAFELLSRNRRAISRRLGLLAETELAERLGAAPAPICGPAVLTNSERSKPWTT